MTRSRYGPRLFWIDIDRHAAQLPVYADLLDTDERARTAATCSMKIVGGS